MKKELNFSVKALKSPEKSTPPIWSTAKPVEKNLLIVNVMPKSMTYLEGVIWFYLSLDG